MGLDTMGEMLKLSRVAQQFGLKPTLGGATPAKPGAPAGNLPLAPGDSVEKPESDNKLVKVPSTPATGF